MIFTDWRYMIVDKLDGLLHRFLPRGWELPILCNLERGMYMRRFDKTFPPDENWDKY